MKVLLRNPRREVEVVPGPVAVHLLLERLEIDPPTDLGFDIPTDLGFDLDKVSHLFAPGAEAAKADLRSCSSCGAATPGDVCAFCKLRARAAVS